MTFTCARCGVTLDCDPVMARWTLHEDIEAPPGWMHIAHFHLCASCRRACTCPSALEPEEVTEAVSARMAEYGINWKWNWNNKLPLRAELDVDGGIQGAVWRDGARVYWTVSAPPSMGDAGACDIPDSIIGIPFELAMKTVAARVLALLDKRAEDAVRRLGGE